MPNAVVTVLVFLICAAVGASVIAPALRRSRRPILPSTPADSDTVTADSDTVTAVAIGTVQSVAEVIVVEVESVSGQKFVGRLRRQENDPVTAALRPGVLLLVAFDPDARERLSLADDIDAVRAAFDQMLVRKGLVTPDQLDLIRHGTRSRGVVTAMRPTGAAGEDHRDSLNSVAPGSLIDAYYRQDDESAVAVCVSPG